MYALEYILVLHVSRWKFVQLFCPNSDMLPAYEASDRKAVNNTIEAYIIAEVKALIFNF